MGCGASASEEGSRGITGGKVLSFPHAWSLIPAVTPGEVQNVVSVLSLQSCRLSVLGSLSTELPVLEAAPGAGRALPAAHPAVRPAGAGTGPRKSLDQSRRNHR